MNDARGDQMMQFANELRALVKRYLAMPGVHIMDIADTLLDHGEEVEQEGLAKLREPSVSTAEPGS